MRNTLFVFDLETIPDTSVVPNLVEDAPEADDIPALRDALEQYHLNITKGANSFPRQMFHEICAFSYVVADIEKLEGGRERYHFKTVKSGGSLESSEAEILRGSMAYLEKERPRLVGYNTRGFDVPVLRFRCMKHGIAARWLYQSGDKWENYKSRYAEGWHCDLLEVLSDYGAATRGMKLNELCAILNLPGKIGVDGSMVTDMFDSGQLDEIRNYCETDVLNTYMVYLHHQHHTGVLDDEGLKRAKNDVHAYLTENQEGNVHFTEFLKAWDAMVEEA